MSAWLKRFGLHLAAAVGATGVFVAAAAVGANQNRPQIAAVSQPIPIVRTRTPPAERKPTVVATPTPTGVSSVAASSGQPTEKPAPATSVPATSTQATENPTPELAGSAAPVPTRADSVGSVPARADSVGSAPAPADSEGSAPSAAASNPAPAPRTKPEAKPPPRPSPTPSPSSQGAVLPERSLAGTIKGVQGDGLDVLGVGGREWHVLPAPGALIRLNGKTAKLDTLQVGQSVVILGQAQPGPGARFLAHAITAKSK